MKFDFETIHFFGVGENMDQTYAAVDQLVRVIFLDVLSATIQAVMLGLVYVLVKKVTK